MTITRTVNGNEMTFELTNEELFFAYIEQERKFDKDNVRNYLSDLTDEDLLSEYGITREKFEELCPDIADEMRRNIDKYDMTFEYALEAAITEVLR